MVEGRGQLSRIGNSRKNSYSCFYGGSSGGSSALFKYEDLPMLYFSNI